MYKMKSTQLGWIVAAALGGILLGGGFQPEAGKLGVVDIGQVMDKSVQGTAIKKTFQDMTTARQDLLTFVETNHFVTMEQAVQLRDLTVKNPVPTPEDKAKIEEIKKQVLDAKAKYEALIQKPSPTDEDKKLITNYTEMGRKMDDAYRQWFQMFSQEMSGWADKQKQTLLEKARQATQEVGKAQGFLLVFDSTTAPYGANDITDATIKAMDAKK